MHFIPKFPLTIERIANNLKFENLQKENEMQRKWQTISFSPDGAMKNALFLCHGEVFQFLFRMHVRYDFYNTHHNPKTLIHHKFPLKNIIEICVDTNAALDSFGYIWRWKSTDYNNKLPKEFTVIKDIPFMKSIVTTEYNIFSISRENKLYIACDDNQFHEITTVKDVFKVQVGIECIFVLCQNGDVYKHGRTREEDRTVSNSLFSVTFRRAYSKCV